MAKSMRCLDSHGRDDRGKDLEAISRLVVSSVPLPVLEQACRTKNSSSENCAFIKCMKVISSTSSCCRDRRVTDGFFQVKARSGAEMDRKLQWWDVIALGVGGMVGAGIFVSTGTAARDHAGPAVVISYLVAGISALLSAFCYTEFAVEMPVAGGAFSYLQITFGEH